MTLRNTGQNTEKIKASACIPSSDGNTDNTAVRESIFSYFDVWYVGGNDCRITCMQDQRIVFCTDDNLSAVTGKQLHIGVRMMRTAYHILNLIAAVVRFTFPQKTDSNVFDYSSVNGLLRKSCEKLHMVITFPFCYE